MPKCGARFAVVVDPPTASAGKSGRPGKTVSRGSLHPAQSDATTSMPAPCASFHGMGGTLGMQIVNVCPHHWSRWAVIISLGQRRRSAVPVQPQRRCRATVSPVHGTGKELYQGFLKAMLVFGIPYFHRAPRTRFDLQRIDVCRKVGRPGVLPRPGRDRECAGYRCTALRGAASGSPFEDGPDFLKLYFRGGSLRSSPWAPTIPISKTQRQAFLHAHTYFGNQRFSSSAATDPG